MSIPVDDQELFVIIEFAEGEFGLCRTNEDGHVGEPLVRIQFSDESRYFLSESLKSAPVEVAKAMLEAGLDAVQELQDDVDEHDSTVHLIH